MDVVQLWKKFLVKHICFFFWLINTIFSNLSKNALKIFKLKKKISYPKYDILTKKNTYFFFSTNDPLAQIAQCLLQIDLLAIEDSTSLKS